MTINGNLTVNGTTTTVRTILAKNWFGEIEVLEGQRLRAGTAVPDVKLARAAAEVCARAEGFADQRYPGAWLELARETADSQDGNHRLNALECAGLCLRAMLACDAAPADGAKGGARG